MSKRKIIEIDREKCNGCGLCTRACAEGALVLDEQEKAVLARAIFCDGMGACLDVCPVGALKIVERDSAGYDPKAAFDHVLKTQGPEAAQKVHGAPGISGHGHPAHFGGCPKLDETQWYVEKVTVQIPLQKDEYLSAFRHADLCAFLRKQDQREASRSRSFALFGAQDDDGVSERLLEKLSELFRNNALSSLTVAIMEVPCCSGLFRMAQEAVEFSGAGFPVKRVVIGLDGTVRG